MTAAFLRSVMIEYTLNVRVGPRIQFMKNLELRHFSLAGQYSILGKYCEVNINLLINFSLAVNCSFQIYCKIDFSL